ncbi:MAG: protein kinase domain-containing protein [Candidatus Xenobia bacterium]
MRQFLVLCLVLAAAPAWAHRVWVESVPIGARVYDVTMAPEYCGVTPCEVNVPPDHGRLELRYPGFEDHYFTVSPGQDRYAETMTASSIGGWLGYVLRQKPWQVSLTLLVLVGGALALQMRRPAGSRPQPVHQDTGLTLVGKTVGDYQVLGRLGEGGFSDVYRVAHTTYGDAFALKLLRSSDAELLRRFQREMEIGVTLHHPNLVRIFATGEYFGHPYLVMELLEGMTLRVLLEERRLPLPRLVHIFTQICEGLSCAHRSGVVHRDLKPENVMLLADDNVRVLDFGVARLMQGTRLTESTASLGTLTYMSPEHVNNEVSTQSDLYSVGVMLFEAVSGRLPLEADVSIEMIYKIMFMPPTPLQDLVPTTPPALCELVNRLLAKKPQERPVSADEVAAALRSLI